jgi:hypothetical protein
METEAAAGVRPPPSLLTRLVEWAWPIAWSLAVVAIVIDRAAESGDAVAGLITAVGVLLTLRALIMLADYYGVLQQMAQRDAGRPGNRVSAALGVTFRSTRPSAALELVIAIAWLAFGISHVT